MEMNVYANKIKKLREEKMFSQEELAIACGIGLRTVQRVEASGTASRDTLKSLAAVLECDPLDLVDEGRTQAPYLNVQLGYTILIVFVGVTAWLSWLFSNGAMPVNVYIVAVAIIAFVLINFCSLTVRVTDTHVKWHFGIGLIRKSLALSEIERCSVVRNKAWWGIGIRRYESGWLYCVSGLNAVELVLKKGGSLRIGTDEPDKLKSAITRALERSVSK